MLICNVCKMHWDILNLKASSHICYISRPDPNFPPQVGTPKNVFEFLILDQPRFSNASNCPFGNGLLNRYP